MKRFLLTRCLGIPRSNPDARTRMFVVCAACLMILQAVGYGKADSLPHTPFSGPLYYVSKEMEPISVEFVLKPWAEDDEDTLKRVVKVPRAYINFVNGYSHSAKRRVTKHTLKSRQRGWSELPEQVRTSDIMVTLIDPDGAPYTVQGLERSLSTQNADGITKRRARSQFAYISLAKDSQFVPITLKMARDKGVSLVEYEGLLFDPGATGRHYYYNMGSGSLRFVRCSRRAEETRPGEFCTYAVSMGDHFIARIQFLDFRLHGGRQYIIDRVGVFLKAMCQHFPCNEEDQLVLSE